MQSCQTLAMSDKSALMRKYRKKRVTRGLNTLERHGINAGNSAREFPKSEKTTTPEEKP